MDMNYLEVVTCDQCGKELGSNSWEINQRDMCPKCYKSTDKVVLNLCEKCGNKLFKKLTNSVQKRGR